MKNYLATLIAATTDDLVEADALEYAIYSGWLKLTYKLDQDKAIIQRQLLTIVDKFRAVAEANQEINAPMQELLGQISDYK